MTVAVINAGSSSLKFALFDGDRRIRGLAQGFGTGGVPEGRAEVSDNAGILHFAGGIPARNPTEAVEWLFGWLSEQSGIAPIRAVGHRVVHGGERFRAPVVVTAAILDQLAELAPLAPLHQPHNLAPIRSIAERYPSVPQVACFDTAFHATQSAFETLIPLPAAYRQRGIRRYGFHGLSYEFVVSQLRELDSVAAMGRTVVCHLGNGASLCALSNGESRATTMSFTALDGIPMGTRCGAIDPGVLLHLLEAEGLSLGELRSVLYQQSGLLGLSGGLSGDMRALLDSPEPVAQQAVDYFCYRIAREFGALAAVLGGLDAIVFTGGIGEHAAAVRERVCRHAAWLGVELDVSANLRPEGISLHADSSGVAVLRIPTDEERQIERHVRALLDLGVH